MRVARLKAAPRPPTLGPPEGGPTIVGCSFRGSVKWHDDGRPGSTHLHVLPQHARPRFPAEHVAVSIDGDELRPAAGLRVRVAALIEDEVLHPAGPRVAD